MRLDTSGIPISGVEDHAALAACSFVPITVADGAGYSVRLHRKLRHEGADVVTNVVWYRSKSAATEVDDLRTWLIANAPRLTEWGWTAAIAGPAALDAIVDARLVEEAAEAERLRRERECCERLEAEAAREIRLVRDETGRHGAPLLVLRTGAAGAEPFLKLRFDYGWERDRVWDWMRWQGARWHAWKTDCGREGAAAVEQRLLAEMLRTEKAVRKAGLGSGGRRPLRFWRGEPA